MLGLIPRRALLWAVLAFVIAIGATGGVLWARWDAVRDYRAELAEKTVRERLDAIQKDRKRDEEIENMGIDDLRDLARGWVRSPD